MAKMLLGNIKGKPGENAKITEVTATVSNTTGTPTVEVTMGGDEQNRSFHFVFSGLKGEQGDSVVAAAYAELTEEQVDSIKEDLVTKKELEKSIEDVRTHYAEEILICDFTFDESWTDESATIKLQNTIDLNKLKAYVDGKSVDIKCEENSEGAFEVQLFDTETSEKLVRFNYSPTTWTGEPDPEIYFAFSKADEVRVELYEENIVTLDEKYLPDSVPTMINYDDVLLCEYTYNSADFEGDTCPTIPLRRIPNRDKIRFYINGEQIPVTMEKGSYGNFYGRLYLGESVPTYFKYWAEENSIVFYNEYDGNPMRQDGDVAQIIEDGVTMLKDADIPNCIARTDEIKAYIDEAIRNALSGNS